jgi:SAM-dependent methyltransferase
MTIRLRLIDHEGESEQLPASGPTRGHPSARWVAEAVRKGICPNERAFDQFLPRELRIVSGQHWTPLFVALRVAKWLDQVGAKTVVDIGSGAGKFCVATALATRCDFTGLEQRPRFVEAARALAQKFGVDDRVRFVERTLSQHAIPAADAYYLYNPFGENLFGPDEHLDAEVELSEDRYLRDVALAEAFFDQARVGTYVIKYNGFGGRMPSSYEEILVDRELPNLLRMWQKTRAT